MATTSGMRTLFLAHQQPGLPLCRSVRPFNLAFRASHCPRSLDVAFSRSVLQKVISKSSLNLLSPLWRAPHGARFYSSSVRGGRPTTASLRGSPARERRTSGSKQTERNSKLVNVKSNKGAVSRPKRKETFTSSKEPVFNVPVILEDSLDATPELEGLLEQLEKDGPLAVKIAVEGLDDLPPYETAELSVAICDDTYIRKLNKDWRGKDSATDVLSFPQHQPPGMMSTLLLGDIIISIDTAAKQAKERGHSVLDELRILLVHGLLHVLGYDHETCETDAIEMEKEELHILGSLGWNSKGLITASMEGSVKVIDSHSTNRIHGLSELPAKSKVVRKGRSPFRVLFCDMDGTVLNSKSKVTQKTADALKAAIAHGVKVIIATGKTRPAVMTAFQPVGLCGENGVVSDMAPGVFCQGLLVYGDQGQVVHSQHLNPDVCLKAFQYSLKNKQPLLGFSGDCTVTLFEHPSIDELHTVYMEPKADIAPSLEHLINNYQVQKLLFPDTAERIASVVRPYWFQETGDLASIVQAQADMLEIIPVGSSKGRGVELLLKHLGFSPGEAMAIGDGENDIEMLELVGWGVAMANGAEKTLSVASAKVGSNDEDGVVEAIERFILT